MISRENKEHLRTAALTCNEEMPHPKTEPEQKATPHRNRHQHSQEKLTAYSDMGQRLRDKPTAVQNPRTFPATHIATDQSTVYLPPDGTPGVAATSIQYTTPTTTTTIQGTKYHKCTKNKISDHYRNDRSSDNADPDTDKQKQ